MRGGIDDRPPFEWRLFGLPHCFPFLAKITAVIEMCMSTECTDGLIHKHFLSRAVLCFPLLWFSPVYGANMSILSLFLLHNQIDKGSKIKIMPLSAVFIAFYFGTGYELGSHEKSITNILMNVVNLLPRLRIIFLWDTPPHTFLPLPFLIEDPY